MKIVCISDTHCQHSDIVLPEGDMLIHAGDLTLRGTVEQLNDFFKWFGSLPFKYKIVVAGNHDFGMEDKIPGIAIPKGVIYLENSSVEVAGLKIWGSPISTPFGNWAFMWDLPRRTALYQTIPDDTDIVINHGPAYGILDLTARDGTNVGCSALAERVKEIKPKLCVVGHIHEAYGTKIIGETTYVNASILNRQYRIANAPIVIEI
ncbi:MAG TPA: metallophosphatase domain-containing protein [Aquella sp.]|nr:metallophosphatase domain-containing protein [Aquella sp.]